jgi:hypothetical protein
MRWPRLFSSKGVTETVTPTTTTDISSAAATLSRHRAEAQRLLVLTTAKEMRASLGLGDRVRVLP